MSGEKMSAHQNSCLCIWCQPSYNALSVQKTPIRIYYRKGSLYTTESDVDIRSILQRRTQELIEWAFLLSFPLPPFLSPPPRGSGLRPKTNLVHSSCQKPLVAIIWVFWSACFTVDRSKFSTKQACIITWSEKLD